MEEADKVQSEQPPTFRLTVERLIFDLYAVRDLALRGEMSLDEAQAQTNALLAEAQGAIVTATQIDTEPYNKEEEDLVAEAERALGREDPETK